MIAAEEKKSPFPLLSNRQNVIFKVSTRHSQSGMCSPDASNYLGTLLLSYFLVGLKTADPNALEFPVEINFDFCLKI